MVASNKTKTASSLGTFSQEMIKIEGLRVDCIVGILPYERQQEQPLLVDVAFDANFSAATNSEKICDTINYAQVAFETSCFIKQGQFKLLETLIRGLAIHLSQKFALPCLHLTVRKPQAITQEQTQKQTQKQAKEQAQKQTKEHAQSATVSLSYNAPASPSKTDS